MAQMLTQPSCCGCFAQQVETWTQKLLLCVVQVQRNLVLTMDHTRALANHIKYLNTMAAAGASTHMMESATQHAMNKCVEQVRKGNAITTTQASTCFELLLDSRFTMDQRSQIITAIQGHTDADLQDDTPSAALQPKGPIKLQKNPWIRN
eukprot:3615390-Karenia_brevis.AAC.1